MFVILIGQVASQTNAETGTLTVAKRASTIGCRSSTNQSFCVLTSVLGLRTDLLWIGKEIRPKMFNLVPLSSVELNLTWHFDLVVELTGSQEAMLATFWVII